MRRRPGRRQRRRRLLNADETTNCFDSTTSTDTDPLDSTDAPTDTDDDGVCDYVDTDDDDDGVADTDDAFPPGSTEDTDTDGDGSDNTDTDDDGDGTADTDDAFPLDASEDTDTDGNGTGDNADTDATATGPQTLTTRSIGCASTRTPRRRDSKRPLLQLRSRHDCFWIGDFIDIHRCDLGQPSVAWES